LTTLHAGCVENFVTTVSLQLAVLLMEMTLKSEALQFLRQVTRCMWMREDPRVGRLSRPQDHAVARASAVTHAVISTHA
jgi:hypothetical protein